MASTANVVESLRGAAGGKGESAGSGHCKDDCEAMDTSGNEGGSACSVNGHSNQVPSLEEQRKAIADHATTRLKEGESWFLVDFRWLQKWKSYVGYDDSIFASTSIGFETDHPGPVDNSALCQDGVLKSHLIDDSNYALVPEEAWNSFVAWYGVADSVSPIARRVIAVGTLRATVVEVYRNVLKLCEPDCETLVSKEFSKADTLEDVCRVAKEHFQYPADSNCRLWTYLSDYQLITDMSATLDEADIQSGDRVMIERQKPDGTWSRSTEPEQSYADDVNNSSHGIGGASQPKSMYSSNFSSSSSYYSTGYSSWSSSKQLSTPGLCGLSNLGNTCFMNSALQCMSNTHLLTEYLLANKHADEINTDNPLGMQGQIAHTYHRLLNDLWSGRQPIVSPREFKGTISRFAPQFSGYAQHDSQEFLAFLLDGLHEDLNRIRKKPYIELKDSDGRIDKEVATEAWDAHRQRNDSVIVDMFQGQFKSRLVCPTCQKVSVTFDPFMFLSLPLPVKKTRQIEVTLVYLNPTVHPKSFVLTVPKHGCVKHMLKELGQKAEVHDKLLVCADVYNHRFHKVFLPGDSLSQILDRDVIFAYELEDAGEDEDVVNMPVYHRELDIAPRSSYQYYSQKSYSLFGFPFFVTVPRHGTTYKALHAKVLHQLSRFVHPERCVVEAPSPCVSNEPGSQEVSDENSLHASAAAQELNNTADTDANAAAQDLNNNGEMEQTRHDAPDISTDEGMAAEDEQKNTTDGEPAVTSANGTSGVANGQETVSPLDLFSLSAINSYGGTSLHGLGECGEDDELELTNHTYLGLDWNESLKRMAYDDEESDKCDTHEASNDATDAAPSKLHLTDCLKLFMTEEQLGEDDPWYCPQCKEHKQAMKKFDIWRLPKVLVIHLKRFSYNRYWRDKLDTLVHFPVDNLDLRPFCLDPDPGYEAVYDLHAVSNHFGGLGGGHYTAFGFNHDKQQWYDFDDSSVSAISQKELVSHSAYVLFYTRRDAAKACNGVEEKNGGSLSAASSEVTLADETAAGHSSSTEDAAMEDESGSVE